MYFVWKLLKNIFAKLVVEGHKKALSNCVLIQLQVLNNQSQQKLDHTHLK